MPLNPATPLSARLATVFEFLPALARRHLSARLGPRCSVHVIAGVDGVLTIARQHRDAVGAEVVEDRFAQLRTGDGEAGYQLFFKKCNGRWTAYCQDGGSAFVGSIDECLAEIARDPFGRYWS